MTTPLVSQEGSPPKYWPPAQSGSDHRQGLASFLVPDQCPGDLPNLLIVVLEIKHRADFRTVRQPRAAGVGWVSEAGSLIVR
jgi:hypothetical protein